MVTVVTATKPSGITETAKLDTTLACGSLYKPRCVHILPQPYIQHVFDVLFPRQSNSHHQQT